MVGINADAPVDAAGALAATRVLVVDDDAAVRRVVRLGLEREGMLVDEASDAGELLRAVVDTAPRLIVLDLNLGTVGGFDALVRLRANSQVPVIVLSGRVSEVDRVLALELGADDYVVKPFSPRELASRVRAVLRRVSAQPASVLDYGDLQIDTASRIVRVRGAVIDLAAREFDLLAYMAAAPGRVFSRRELLEGVWRLTDEWQDPATVTEHVRRVRAKLERGEEHPRWIRTVRAAGYAFEP